MWTKIDDGYFDNEKVLRASCLGTLLHLTSMVWASGHSVTGVLPKPVLPTLLAKAKIPARMGRALAAELVTLNLWEEVSPDHWLVHDFIPYTPPAERLKSAERLKVWREKQAQRNGDETAMKRKLNGNETPVKRNVNASPVPVPVPVREIETPNGVSKESQRVFDTWVASKGNTPGLRLTSDRERLIRARLREGYSVEDLEAAACGWQNDPWEGRAQQNDLKYLLRNGGMVEKFRDLWRNGPPTPALFKPDGSVARSQARVRAFEALADTLEHPQLSEGA